MLRYLHIFNGVGAFVGAVLTIAAVTETAEPPATEAGRRQTGAEARATGGERPQAGAQSGRLDGNDKTAPAFLRMSQIVGEDIYNLAGEDVGEVEDLVVEGQAGKVRYAVVTYGGFLGIGEKMFAVPWDAFRCKADPDDSDELYLYLDVSQETLEGMEGFDEDSWPNFDDRNFTQELDRRYKIDRSQTQREARIQFEGQRGAEPQNRR